MVVNWVNGIETMWYDKSHLNRYLLDHKPTKVLSLEDLRDPQLLGWPWRTWVQLLGWPRVMKKLRFGPCPESPGHLELMRGCPRLQQRVLTSAEPSEQVPTSVPSRDTVEPALACPAPQPHLLTGGLPGDTTSSLCVHYIFFTSGSFAAVNGSSFMSDVFLCQC
ncbi:hypothetical protein GH733_018875 [Mirounga leonina]|nr:hypothetical protein GH733_018875 [Mirounga leonina]